MNEEIREKAFLKDLFTFFFFQNIEFQFSSRENGESTITRSYALTNFSSHSVTFNLISPLTSPNFHLRLPKLGLSNTKLMLHYIIKMMEEEALG